MIWIRLVLRIGRGTDARKWHNSECISCRRRCPTSACCRSTCPVTSTTIRHATRIACRRSRKACSVPTCRDYVAAVWTTTSADWQTNIAERQQRAPEVRQSGFCNSSCSAWQRINNTGWISGPSRFTVSTIRLSRCQTFWYIIANTPPIILHFGVSKNVCK